MVVWFVMAQLTVSAVLKLIKSENLIVTTFSVEAISIGNEWTLLKKFFAFCIITTMIVLFAIVMDVQKV